jgi:hypothetical protein
MAVSDLRQGAESNGGSAPVGGLAPLTRAGDEAGRTGPSLRRSVDRAGGQRQDNSLQSNGCERAIECGVPPERVINSRPAEDLLTWTS